MIIFYGLYIILMIYFQCQLFEFGTRTVSHCYQNNTVKTPDNIWMCTYYMRYLYEFFKNTHTHLT